MTKNIENSEVNIKKYKIIRCDSHSRHTGGVAIYIKNRINFSIVSNMNYLNNIWILALKIINRNINGVFVVIYHSPSSSDAIFVNYFHDWCTDNLNPENINIITGDFNINLLVKNTYSDQILKVIDQIGMKQLVKSPTRVTKTSKSLIDYIISNNYIMKVVILYNEKISDHETISFSINDKKINDNKYKCVNKIVNYSKEIFVNNLLNIQWSEGFKLSANQKANFVISNIKKCIHEFIKSVKTKNTNNQQWYNNQLWEGRKQRNMAYRIATIPEQILTGLSLMN